MEITLHYLLLEMVQQMGLEKMHSKLECQVLLFYQQRQVPLHLGQEQMEK